MSAAVTYGVTRQASGPRRWAFTRNGQVLRLHLQERSAKADAQMATEFLALIGEESALVELYLQWEADRAAYHNAPPVTRTDGFGNWHAIAPTALDARGAILDELEERGDATPGEYDIKIAPCPIDAGCWTEVI